MQPLKIKVLVTEDCPLKEFFRGQRWASAALAEVGELFSIPDIRDQPTAYMVQPAGTLIAAKEGVWGIYVKVKLGRKLMTATTDEQVALANALIELIRPVIRDTLLRGARVQLAVSVQDIEFAPAWMEGQAEPPAHAPRLAPSADCCGG